MMMESAVPHVQPFVAGRWVDGDAGIDTVLDKFNDRSAATVGQVSGSQVTAAVEAAVVGARTVLLSPAERHRILERAAALVIERAEELQRAVSADTGFVHQDVVKEVGRTSETLRLCANEAKHLAGEVVPLSGIAGNEKRLAFTRYDPLGVVCAITPFNSPLNTVAHKVGPALAAGNGVVLKPAAETPQSADAFLRVLLDAGVPPELLTVVYGEGATVGPLLTADDRMAYYAFTGSTQVGRRIHASVGMRKTQLEMGSLSSTIVCDDADIEACVPKVVAGAFRKSGQVCTSVQRLYVHDTVAEDVAQSLVEALAGKASGDPSDPGMFVGPLISPGAARRVETWIADAVSEGAELLLGGSRTGNVVEPTILRNCARESAIMRNEVFGPVILLQEYSSLDRAIEDANDTPFGLASGIFTRNISVALDAAERLRTGGVHINETSSSRVDLMPFIGMKGSGFGGAEGPRYAVRDMSQERLITISS